MNDERGLIKLLLRENLQQAEKLYFKDVETGEQMRQAVMSVTNGDAFTKLVADLVYHFAKFTNNKIDDGIIRLAKRFHEQLEEYDNKVFPVSYNLNQYGRTDDNDHHIMTLVELINQRHTAVFNLRKLPSIAIRNLKSVTQKKYSNQYELKDISEKMSRLAETIKLLSNVNSDKSKVILQKILSSNNDLNAMVDVAKHYEHAFLDSEEVTQEEVLDSVRHNDAEIIQRTSNLLVIKVNSLEAMTEISCTSLWCFSRPNAQQFWEDYAAYGYVYVIYDFSKSSSDSTFLLTYLDNGELFVSTNVPISEIIPDTDTYPYLRSIGVDISKLEYEYSDEEAMVAENKIIIKNFLRE